MIPSALLIAAHDDARLRSWAPARRSDIAKASVQALGASILDPFSLPLPRGVVTVAPSLDCVAAWRDGRVALSPTVAGALAGVADPSERDALGRLLRRYRWPRPPRGSDPLPVWTADGVADLVGRLGALGFWASNTSWEDPAVTLAIPFADATARVYVAEGGLYVLGGPVAIADFMSAPPDPQGLWDGAARLRGVMGEPVWHTVEDRDGNGREVGEHGQVVEEDGLWALERIRMRY